VTASHISPFTPGVLHNSIMAKRKRSAVATANAESETMYPSPAPYANERRSSMRRPSKLLTDPNVNPEVEDGKSALRASPDSDTNREIILPHTDGVEDSDSPLSDVPDLEPPKKKRQSSSEKIGSLEREEPHSHIEAAKPRNSVKREKLSESDEALRGDPDADGFDEEADPEEIKAASLRPPPVNSSYLPLPWKGRLGYACLCTYLRNSTPPVFSSRTTRIASILEHRHPLKHPSQPEHAIKNRPDKEKPAEVRRGQAFIEQLCLANVQDMAKMIRWNDRYGIKFLRLSSEAFPFASHPEYGYKLAPFAADALAEVGKVIAELGHRVSTHPGQFTQLGSPRASVIENAIRDLTYHDEMLSLLKLPEQQDRDAVMVLHMGGVFGDKAATMDRFRKNYAALSPSIKRRLVLENDDVCYSVHDLLPICQELSIPLVLDFHHNNIIFDASHLREGTQDIIALYPEIRETWTSKGITQKMHYSEPTPAAITGMQRRKHNPRPSTLPPCPDDMDLMIEAKDKEQAVFQLMRTFRLPGFETINDIVPFTRFDDNKSVKVAAKKTPKKRGKKMKTEEDEEESNIGEATNDEPPRVIPEDEVGMGGPEGRVYWPPGMEEWLRPVKRVVKKKETPLDSEAAKIALAKMTPAEKKAMMVGKKAAAAASQRLGKGSPHVDADVIAKADANGLKTDAEVDTKAQPPSYKAKTQSQKSAPPRKAAVGQSRAVAKKTARELTPMTSDEEVEDMSDGQIETKLAQAERELEPTKVSRATSSRQSGRAAKRARVSYVEEEEETDKD